MAGALEISLRFDAPKPKRPGVFDQVHNGSLDLGFKRFIHKTYKGTITRCMVLTLEYYLPSLKQKDMSHIERRLGEIKTLATGCLSFYQLSYGLTGDSFVLRACISDIKFKSPSCVTGSLHQNIYLSLFFHQIHGATF